MGEGRLRRDLVVAVLGAVLGFGAVFAIPNRTLEREPDAANSSPSRSRANSESHRNPLPEPKSLALAALGGRTKPARARFSELWAQGDDSEEWIDLAVALICADPAWFAEFNRTHDESEVHRLLRATLPRLEKVHPDSYWRLLGESESVRQFVSGPDFKTYHRIAIAGTPDAAFDFVMAHWDVLDGRVRESALSRGARQPERARQALQRWREMADTSDSDDLPDHIKTALWTLHKHDDSALSEALEDMDGETRAVLEGELRVMQHTREDGRVPLLRPEDLVGLNEAQAKKLIEEQAKAGLTPSADSLMAFGREERGSAALKALGECYRWMGRTEVERFLEEASRLELNEADRVRLEVEAAEGDWTWFSDIDGALARLDQLPDNDITNPARESIIAEWIYVDPLAVTRYAESLPAGEFRDDLLTRAREASP